jgi:histidinol-phosphate/aromatic aminotransferase/cobyric acid decarboxylase-like protein
MNFQAYKALARDILASERGPGLLRLDCMNPVKALAALRARPPERPPRASISDLDAAWRARWELAAVEGRVVLSTGVRPLLARLFAALARDGRSLCAPEDVYPVYLELARAAGLAVDLFPTVPAPALPPVAATGGREVLLIPEPLVPLGRGLDDAEAARIGSWLARDPERLLVLDCVYTFGARFTDAARTFLAGGRTILVHSLAKSFLAPDLAGFAIGPANVLAGLDHEIDERGRGAAVHLLREAPDLPERLAREIARRWSLLPRVAGLAAPATGYFSVLPIAFDELLARDQLAVPGSVFGARSGGWCAATCLLAGDT